MTIFAGKKKKGESKADKTRSCVRLCVRTWRSEFMNQQKAKNK